jgi:hypothetical protein
LSRGYKEVCEPYESRLFRPIFVETTFGVEIFNESQLVSGPFPRLSLVPLGFSKGGIFTIRHFLNSHGPSGDQPARSDQGLT